MTEKPYQSFERQVELIHRLLDTPGAEVTWNDHLPDPDDPDRQRQIDVSIKREGRLTIVECRAHKARQDVQWVEQLAGRRVSLNADLVIGVSNSGFTDLAIAKARRLGVILRDFASLSPEEVSQWGNRSALTLIFYEFRDTEIVFSGVNVANDRKVEIKGMQDREILVAAAERLKVGFEESNFRSFHLLLEAQSVQRG